MSRDSLQEKRLRFFERGNTQCPICLTPFTEPDVRAGKVVTLEHAPQKSLGGKPACLTCVECNTGVSTGMMDRAVARYQRAHDEGGYPLTIEEGEERTTINPKYIEIDEREEGTPLIRVKYPNPPAHLLRWGTALPEKVNLMC